MRGLCVQTEGIFGSQDPGCVSVFGSIHRECLLISQVVKSFYTGRSQFGSNVFCRLCIGHHLFHCLQKDQTFHSF